MSGDLVRSHVLDFQLLHLRVSERGASVFVNTPRISWLVRVGMKSLKPHIHQDARSRSEGTIAMTHSMLFFRKLWSLVCFHPFVSLQLHFSLT